MRNFLLIDYFTYKYTSRAFLNISFYYLNSLNLSFMDMVNRHLKNKIRYLVLNTFYKDEEKRKLKIYESSYSASENLSDANRFLLLVSLR